MGRQKQTPTRLVRQQDDREVEVQSEVLGRVQLQASTALDCMLARELAADLEGNDQRDRSGTGTANHRDGASCPAAASSDDDHACCQDDQTPASLPRMPPTLAAIERNIAERERAERLRRSCRMKIVRTKRKNSSSCVVQFAEVSSLEVTIPSLELEMKGEDDGTVLLQFGPGAENDVVRHQPSSESLLLARFELPRSKIVLIASSAATPIGSCETAPSFHPVTTERAIRDLWTKFGLPESKDLMENLLLCVEADWLQLFLSSPLSSPAPSRSSCRSDGQSPASLQIFLTQRAVVGCGGLPTNGRPKKNVRRFATAVAVGIVIQALFDGVSADGSDQPILAKRVYDLVDNKQLARYCDDPDDADRQRKEFPTLDIDGLVPTLRPYQAAAVQWMLERERSSRHGDEWKIAWTVLLPTTRETVPLIEWEQINSIAPSESATVCLYCPFTGWIANNIKRAKKMTIAGAPELTKGGILAESMGLGKTVEMIACILANPMESEYSEKKQNTNVTHVGRQLRFDDNDELEPTMVESEQEKSGSGQRGASCREKVALISDVADFGDDDESSVGDDGVCFQNASLNTLATPPIAGPAPVTPDKEVPQSMEVEERWLDDSEVGSCICGDLICFPSHGMKQKRKIVVCRSCEEPMHLECTCMEPADLSKLQRLDLRRTFSNETLECALCDECPSCIVGNRKVTKSRATLIICPPAILEQWEREIIKHTKREDGQPLKVLVYDGVEMISKRLKKRPHAMRLLHPTYLANADILLMSFEALMADLGHSDENRYLSRSEDGFPASGHLRKRKRYRVVPSPLSSICFWRVCIDEAQRVEQSTTKSARMALKLDAVHRWAVSGTPIGRGKLEDLYGLLLFLRMGPFDNKSWYNNCMRASIAGVDNRIQELLCNVFWRSTKGLEIVRRQIGIPEMEEERVLLKFSSIERHFYSQQLERTLRVATDTKQYGNFGVKRKSSRFEYLADHLHSLRAACCHPQVGATGVAKARGKKARNDSGVASRVMTMEQILDRFIDDSRHKCEEAQRVAIMHTNAMAALTGLQVEAKARGVKVSSDDLSLMIKSGDLYREAIDLARTNGTPVLVSADAKLAGNIGFCVPDNVFRDGKCKLEWKMQQPNEAVWAKIDYQGSSRKLTRLRVRSVRDLPRALMMENSVEFCWQLLVPTTVVLQVASLTGGEFVDVASGVLPWSETNGQIANEPEWLEISDFDHTKKSKNWRIVAKMPCAKVNNICASTSSAGYFVGLDVEFYESEIGSDPLQLLHSLHNACLSYDSAIRIPSIRPGEVDESCSFEEITNQIVLMRKQADQIESLYKTHSQSLHTACMMKLQDLVEKRQEKENQLFDVTCLTKPRREIGDCLDDGCFDDFLGLCCLYGTDSQQISIFDRIVQDVEGLHVEDAGIRFPDFSELSGLKAALQMRISRIRSDGLGKKQTSLPATTADDEFVQVRSARYKCGKGEHSTCMSAIRMLTADPDAEELSENSHCRLCKADWNQTGPICRHCKIAEVLQDLRPDPITVAILTAIYAAMRTPAGHTLLVSKEATHMVERAKLFFDVLEAEEREKIGAWRMWRVHSDLMNDFDELSSCKSSIRLSYEGEDLTRYTEDQLNAIVQPVQIMSDFHTHAAKQAMALGDLRRATGTLRYLMNQNKANSSGTTKEAPETCVVCLQVLDGECAVLRCGHRFHQKPCFDQILARSGDPVFCPMKCPERTCSNDVMIASRKASDDGSSSSRKVKGSYGTKVTRIVSDILTMRDRGEKGVVFSQWNDMLEIVDSALSENGVVTARPTGTTKFGESVRRFQSPACAVLLLNLKQGAEGLTLTMATHVFMVEPVMNAALDKQAINRIHRIGQTRKTHVWRYLVENSIEMKLDRMRLKCQDDDEALSDSTNAAHNSLSAGGLDGCFESREELLEVLSETIS